MQTGENDQAMRKILDMTRLISVVVLLLHFYRECYGAFVHWHLVSAITDRFLGNVVKTGLFSSFLKPKLAALVFLAIALIGVKGRKDEKQTLKTAVLYLITGLLFFLASYALLLVHAEVVTVACLYMGVTGLGYLLMMSGGTMLSRIIRDKLQGDFFVESPINFLTAIIWYLRKYQDGEFCTLPHVIELMQADYDSLFTILSTQKEIDVLINPFISAYRRDAVEQLEGQIASAKITMARIASPQLYYILSGNEFTLDINNPATPKIVCMGNNPQKIQIYGAVLSLFANRLLKIINQKNKLKCSLVFDEFSALTTDIYLPSPPAGPT